MFLLVWDNIKRDYAVRFIYHALLRAKAVAEAFVFQMESEASKLRAAKTALEGALSTGASLVDVTKDLHTANTAYNEASMQVRKNCSQPKPKSKAKAKAKASAAAA